MKTLYFLLVLSFICLLSGCTSQEPTFDNVQFESNGNIVYIKDGKILPYTRQTSSEGTPALSFKSDNELRNYCAILSTMQDDDKLEFSIQQGITPLYALEDSAYNELVSIDEAAQDEEEFLKLYSGLVEKYKGRLIQNNVYPEDLTLYLPVTDVSELAYIANENGDYVVGDKIIHINPGDLHPSVVMRSLYILQAPNETPLASFKNGYCYSPQKKKRVTGYVFINSYGNVQLEMYCDKKMWYGWRMDKYRDYIFEIKNLNGISYYLMSNMYYWCKGTSYRYGLLKQIAKTAGGKITGTIHTWTDLTASYDKNGNLIMIDKGGILFPKCEYSQSIDIIVDL